MKPIRIYVSRNLDGYGYQLDPLSRVEIQREHPGARPSPTLFVGAGTKADFESVHGPAWSSVAEILSGLSRKDIGRVQFVDPKTDAVVFDSEGANA